MRVLAVRAERGAAPWRIILFTGLLAIAIAVAAALWTPSSTTITPTGATTSTEPPPIVVLVSIDGWRWDYLSRFEPPAISRLAQAGVVAEGLVPIFPSKTYPNHYSIVTGLYADHHGIISNNMVDPALPGRFTLNNRDVQQDSRWWLGEPIWVTAERQGRVAATMFWPGSEVEIAGDRPTFWRDYEHELPNAARVDQLLEWLDRPDPERPTFLTLYFAAVDDAGHNDGPDAEETRQAALAVDAAIARLIAGIDRLGLLDRVNFVLVSDHGMSALSRDRVIVLDEYLDLSTVDLIDVSPIVGANPRGNTTAAQVYEALAGKHPALQVYTRSTLPERFRLRNHPRVPEIIGLADDGWHVTTRSRLAIDDLRGSFPRGNHGFDPQLRSMHGLFVASGPALQSGLVVPAFENVHVYELLCRLLGVKPAPNDGDPAVTEGFLRAATTAAR